MPGNWVENKLIADIDRSYANVEASVLEERIAENDQCLRLFSAAIVDGYERASQFSDKTIGQLRQQVEPGFQMGQALKELGHAKRNLDLFKSRYPELSRRRIRRLTDTDESVDLRICLSDLEFKLAEAQQRYDDIMACWQARDFLRTVPDLVAMVLRVNRRSAQRFTADRLSAMFPD